MKTEKIYVISTEGDCEGRGPKRIIGYAKGNEADIIQFFGDKKYYSLYLKQVDVITVNSSSIAEKSGLKRERNELSNRLRELETQIKSIDGLLKCD